MSSSSLALNLIDRAIQPPATLKHLEHTPFQPRCLTQQQQHPLGWTPRHPHSPTRADTTTRLRAATSVSAQPACFPVPAPSPCLPMPTPPPPADALAHAACCVQWCIAACTCFIVYTGVRAWYLASGRTATIAGQDVSVTYSWIILVAEFFLTCCGVYSNQLFWRQDTSFTRFTAKEYADLEKVRPLPPPLCQWRHVQPWVIGEVRPPAGHPSPSLQGSST